MAKLTVVLNRHISCVKLERPEIVRAIRRDPDEAYPSTLDLMRALQDCHGSRSCHARGRFPLSGCTGNRT
jgi:hypothetical protein